MIKQTIGRKLKTHLSGDFDIVKISRWAHGFYMKNILLLDLPLKKILETLFSMEDSAEFELDEAQLNELANRLIEEGEREELGDPSPDIKSSAEDIGKGWLYCPICHEAWESASAYGMVKCPGCQNKLLNPKYKTL